jgi:hypothetical protein
MASVQERWWVVASVLCRWRRRRVAQAWGRAQQGVPTPHPSRTPRLAPPSAPPPHTHTLFRAHGSQTPRFECPTCIRTFALLGDIRAHTRLGCDPHEAVAVLFKPSLADPASMDEVQCVADLATRNQAVRDALEEAEEEVEEAAGDGGDGDGPGGAGGASAAADE